MKRLAPALVVAIVALLTAPAFAQTGVTARITAPNDGQTVTGTVGVHAEASAGVGVKSVKLFLQDILVGSAEPSNLRQEAGVDYSWDTKNALTGGLARNGWYTLRVEATANGGATDKQVINVALDDPPQSPTGLDHWVSGQTVSLTWTANPEPDIIGYRVEVSTGDDAWSAVTQTTHTAYSGDVDPGSYEYRVVALRSSPSLAEGRASSPTTPVPLTVQAVGADGTPAKGGRGRNGGGMFGDADPRVFGRDGRGTRHDARSTARGFAGGGISFGGLSLPGQIGLPSLPGSRPFEWGTYKEKLPYSIPEGGIAMDAAPARLAALSTTTVLPLDGLRWVASGLLMIVLAGLMQMLGMRGIAEKVAVAQWPTIDLNAVVGRLRRTTVPTVSFDNALIRVRRVQDRVRTTWTKARGR
jgi:hypothetical protein